MGYRNLAEALEARRRVLENERTDLEAKLRDRDALDERKREVETELRTLDAQLTQPKRLPMLQRITVASPCSADWEAMAGDDRRRFCSKCNKHVYNLSAMSTDEAEALVYETEGKLCARFYRRKDGTILTSDCPDRSRRRKRLAVAGVFGAALAAGAGLLAPGTAHTMGAIERIEPAPPPPVMGSVAAPAIESPPPFAVAPDETVKNVKNVKK